LPDLPSHSRLLWNSGSAGQAGCLSYTDAAILQHQPLCCHFRTACLFAYAFLLCPAAGRRVRITPVQSKGNARCRRGNKTKIDSWRSVLSDHGRDADGGRYDPAFLDRIREDKAVTVGQLLRELVLPHIVLLAGLGLLTAAFVLYARRAIIHRRQQHGEP